MTLCSLLAVLTGNAQGIKFEQNLSWQQIQAKAKAENKYIFMDAYTTWCGPCKAMSSETFPKKEVGDYMNDQFISVKVQVDQTKDDNAQVKSWYTDAEAIDQQYKITAYPTVFFFSPEGKLVHRSIGYKDVAGLIEEAKKALDSKSQYYTLLEKYKQGQMDTAAMKALVFQADAIGDNVTARKIAEAYTSHIKKRDLYKRKNLLFIGKFLNGSQDKSFRIFLEEANKVNKIVDFNNYAQNTVMDIIYLEEIAPYDDHQVEKPDWETLEKKVKTKYGKLGEEQIWGNRMNYYGDIKDWQNFGKYYALYYKEAFSHSRYHINNLSWPIFEHITDPSVLEVAVKTMKFSIENYDQTNYQAYDTYANLLYKVGKKQEAIEWEEKAVKALPNDKGLAETLEKMKRGEKTWKE
jgi:thioredoxin-related protein